MDATAGAGTPAGRTVALHRALSRPCRHDRDGQRLLLRPRSAKPSTCSRRSRRCPTGCRVLLGNSGVGKSSLAQAGVLAALKRQAWPEGDETTGAWPARIPRQPAAGAFSSSRPAPSRSRRWSSRSCDTWQLETTDPRWEKRQNGLDRGAARRQGHAARSPRRDRAALRRSWGSPSPPAFFLYVDQGEELYVRSEERQRRRFSELLAQAARRPAPARHDEPALRLLRRAAERRAALRRAPADQRAAAARGGIARGREPSGRASVRALRDRRRLRPTSRAARREESAKDAGALPLLSYLLDDMWTQMVERGDGVLRAPAASVRAGRRAGRSRQRLPGAAIRTPKSALRRDAHAQAGDRARGRRADAAAGARARNSPTRNGAWCRSWPTIRTACW